MWSRGPNARDQELKKIQDQGQEWPRLRPDQEHNFSKLWSANFPLFSSAQVECMCCLSLLYSLASNAYQ